ncbi:hypothetical protein [Pseudomonas hormoni]
MEIVKISIIKDGEHQYAELICDSTNLSITLIMKNDRPKVYFGDDFYKCLGHTRNDNREIIFLCKGAKINVHPSTMSSQMTLGVKAYELTLGKPALRNDVVNIFDYEEHDLTNDPKVQEEFFMRWIESEITHE